MDHPSKRRKTSGAKPRNQAAVGGKGPVGHGRKKPQSASLIEDAAPSAYDLGKIAPLQEQIEQSIGGKHRLLHRRQASTSNLTVVTVSVFTSVDSSASVMAASTEASTSAPSVPSVPPFPSDLTVPAVPQQSSVSMPQVPSYPFNTASTTGLVNIMGSSQVVLSSPPATPVSPTYRNSTITSTTSSITFAGLSFTRNSSTTSHSSTSSSPASSSRHSTISKTSSSKLSSSTSDSSSAAATTSDGVVFGPAAVPLPSSTSTAAIGSSDKGSSTITTTTANIVGGVVGGLAGMAAILLLALLILRWNKRKRQNLLRLDENETGDAQQFGSPGPLMAERSSFLPPAAASFFTRFSNASRTTASSDAVPIQERGFQRISGRKLPSAFSEGMTSRDFDNGTLSNASFYRDDQGFYGGPGMSSSIPRSEPKAQTHEKETLMPSPARTPVVHHAGDWPSTPKGGGSTLSPTHSPAHPEPRGTLGRSLHSHDGSRGSKFTEDV